MTRLIPLIALIACLAFPALAPANPSSLSSSLTTQVFDARAQLKRHQQQLVEAERRMPALRRMQTQALAQSPIVARRLSEAKSRVAAAKRRLNKITLAYIGLVESLGGSASGAGATDEQRLLQYLSQVRARDAALVLQQGKGLMERKQQMMDKLRSAAGQLERDRDAALSLATRQQQLEWQSTRAVMENRERIDYLRSAIRADRSNLARLETRLGILSSANGGVLTGGQVLFSYYLAQLSGLDVNLIKAWVLAEMSGGYARARQTEGNHNWLNIGYFDSLSGDGAFQDIPRVWTDPQSAARASQAFLQGDFLGASPGIQRILSTAGRSVETQIRSISTSGWASSGYNSGNSLRGTYKLVPKTVQPPRTGTAWRSPKDGRWYWLGKRKR